MTAVYLIITALFGFLALASGVSFFLKPQKRPADLRQRILSWWIILPLFSLTLISQSFWFLLLLCFISFMSFKEFISVIPTRQGDRILIFIAYLAIPAQFIFSWKHNTEFAHFISIYLFLFLAILAITLGEIKGMLVSVATIYWGLILTVYCLSFLAYLYTIPVSVRAPAGGIGLVLYLVVLTQLNDVAQYCWGKLIGGPKILPQVSPNKTIAGFLGGVLTTALLSIALSIFLLPFSLAQAAFLGGLIALCGFLGDILVSGIKRDMGIKDFSKLIPAHGGMLDRIDSLVLAAPLFLYYLKSFHVGGL